MDAKCPQYGHMFIEPDGDVHPSGDRWYKVLDGLLDWRIPNRWNARHKRTITLRVPSGDAAAEDANGAHTFSCRGADFQNAGQYRVVMVADEALLPPDTLWCCAPLMSPAKLASPPTVTCDPTTMTRPALAQII
jgi:hypothetical protein